MPVSTFEGVATGAPTASAVGFDQIVVPSGGSAVVSTSNPYRGSQCLICTTGSAGGTCYAERTTLLGASSSGQVYGRARFRVPVLPGDTTGMRLLVVTDGPGAFAGDVRVSNLGKLQLRSGAGTLLATSTMTLTADQWVDVGLAVLVFSSTVGQLEMRIWNADGSVAETLTSAASLNTLNSGGTNKAQAGAIRSGVNGFAVAVDDVDWSTSGYPTLALPAPPGLSVPAAVGGPTLSWSGTSAPAGVAAAVAVGGPVGSVAVAAAPAGLAVPVTLGSPSGSQPGALVRRPYTGSAARPVAGITVRPYAGTTARP